MPHNPIFFESWSMLGRVAMVGAVSFLMVVLLLRLTGHESLAQMNVVDFVFVVALGNIVASGITDLRTITAVFVALAVFIGIRVALQWLSMRSRGLEYLLNGRPILLFRDGRFLDDEMKKHDVAREELLGAIRQANISCVDDVEAVVLEVNGSFSVIERRDDPTPAERSTLADVEGAAESKTRGAREMLHPAAALLVVVVAISGLSACSARNETPALHLTGTQPHDSTKDRAHFVGVVQGLYEPESARYDSAQDVFFISNVMGDGSAKDSLGYILRVNAANYNESSLFAVSGRNGVQLDAPKGLAIQGDTLWTTDIDVLRGFDRRTGKPVATIDLKPYHAVLLNDIVAAPDGFLYVSDTGILMTDKGVVYVGDDKVFGIGPKHAVKVIARGSALGRPNGVAWNPKTQDVLIVSFDPFHSELYSLDPRASTRRVLAAGSGEWDGLELLADGRALVTSWADSSVHLIAGKSDEQIIYSESTPADLGLDTRRGIIAVPRIFRGRVDFWKLALN